MNRDRLKRLAGFGLVVVSLTLVAIAWYAHLVLRRAEIYHTVMATLFFGSCAVVGWIYMTAERYTPRWFTLDPQSLRRSQLVLSAIAALIFAISALWLAIMADELNMGVNMGLRIILAFGFFFFGWIALITFKRAFQRK